MMTEPLVSIIMPVFNSEKYIEQSLKSVLNQYYQNWELIIINDGSNDRSIMIIEKFTKKDNRIRLYNKDNGGVSSARNLGIKKARGEWIFFCDSDDSLDPDSLTKIVSNITEDIDLISYLPKIIKEENIIIPRNKINHYFLSPEEYSRYLFSFKDGYYHGYISPKLFRGSILRKYNLLFDEKLRYNEDRLFILKYLSIIQGKCVYNTDTIYNYFERKSGAMGSIYTNKNYYKFEDDIDALIKMYMISKKKWRNKNLNYDIKKTLLNSEQINKSLIIKYSKNKKEDLKRIRNKTSQVCKFPFRIIEILKMYRKQLIK